MNKPRGIIVFGANGSGKTTLGRELARILNFKRMDIEDYYFQESEIPYTNPRSREDCLNLMLADIEKYGSFVLSAVTGEFGDIIEQFYTLGVYISAPLELRMERIKRRAFEKHGNRVIEGGDMYEQSQKFFDFAASRSLIFIEQYAETLACPVIRVDGTLDWRENASNISAKYMI
jgi:cytidylate kinase